MTTPLTRTLLPAALFAAALFLAPYAHAQRPADQDKTGEGATGKKQPLPALNNEKTSSDPGKKMDGMGKPAQPAPGATDKALNTGADGKPPADAKADDDTSAPGGGAGGGRRGGGGGKGGPGGGAPPEKTAYDYELPAPDGKRVPLSDFKGKVLLIVNLGRNSSYNTQLAALQKLNDQYKGKGLVVIGVPSNEFGAAEPGTDAEIDKVYQVEDKVTFPIMARSPLTGDSELPFYQWMTKAKAVPENGPVHWNYTKFLLDKKGEVVARFDPDVAPDSPELLTTLDQVMSGRFKPRSAGDGAAFGRRGGGGGGMAGADGN